MFSDFTTKNETNSRTRLYCNSCERVTIHVLGARCEGSWSSDLDGVSGGETYSIYRCGGCDTVCFERSSWNSENYDHDENGDLVAIYDSVQYPAPISRDFKFDKSHTPGKLDSILDQTQNSFISGGRLLATIGLRLAIEFITADQNTSGSNLSKKIDDLHNKGLIDLDQKGLLHKVRLKGNKGAHEAQEMTQKEIVAGMEVVSILIDKLYNAPERNRLSTARAKKVLG